MGEERLWFTLLALALVLGGGQGCERTRSTKPPPADQRQLSELQEQGTKVLQFYQQGRYWMATRAQEQAVAICRRLYPADRYPEGHPELSTSLNNLGGFLQGQGDYERARKYLEEVLQMRRLQYPKKTYPSGHQELATSFNNLAGLLGSQGNYAEASKYCEEALEISRRLDSKQNDPDGLQKLAQNLNNLGWLLLQAGESYEGARAVLVEALELRRRLYPEKEYPDGHREIASSLTNLGGLLQTQGEYGEAKKFFIAALEAWGRLYPERSYPDGHSNLATGLNNLGKLLEAQGDYEGATRRYKEAIDVSRRLYPAKSYPDGHSDLATSLNNLGRLLQSQGKYDRALKFLEDAAVMNQRLASTFFTGSAAIDSLRFASYHLGAPHGLLSTWPHTNEPPGELYTHVWMRRGAIQSLLSNRQQALQKITVPRVRKLYEQFLSIRRKLGALAIKPTEVDARRASWVSQQKSLRKERERLARELDRELPWFHRALERQRRPHTDLIGRLPPGSVFVDLLHYIHFEQDRDAPGKKGARRVPSYVAFLLRPDEKVTWVSLGPAATLDAAVVSWRNDIEAEKESSATEILHRRLWSPLERHFPPGTKTVFLCPDRNLSALPWAALPGKRQGSVLLEDYALATVPSGQFLLEELMRESSVNDGKGPLLLVGDVTYDKRAASGTKGFQLAVVQGHERSSWSPLPATQAELEAVMALAGKRPMMKLAGANASTQEVLNELPRARCAHLATHGFFASPRVPSMLQTEPMDLDNQVSFVGRNPLALSGLALTGAGLEDPKDGTDKDRGILTAGAIASLPLRGLRLAVLSACETDPGNITGGEGVFGLQRAFHQAGAQNVVASLWRVDADAKATLLRLFYHKLWVEKKPPLQALREAQMWLYAHPEDITGAHSGRTPIKLWASFTLSGKG